MTKSPRGIRSALLVAGLGATALVTATVGVTAAQAAPGDRVTVDGDAAGPLISTPGQIVIAGRARPTCAIGDSRDITLSLTTPSGVERTLATDVAPCEDSDHIVADFNPARSRNGHYVATLGNGRGKTELGFDLRIPPATPQDFAASAHGTTVHLHWTAVGDPDVAAYDIQQDNTDATPDGLDPSSACSNGSCSWTHDFGTTAYGTTSSFAVRALRCGASCDSGDQVAGAPSESRDVTFAATAPSPTPSSSTGPGPVGPAPTGGKHPGSGSQPVKGATTHGAKPSASASPDAKRKHRAGTTPSPSPDPSKSPSPTATVLAGGAGTVRTQPAEQHVAAGGVSDSVTSNIRHSPVWRSLAAAVVLLLLGLHLRLWATRSPTAEG